MLVISAVFGCTADVLRMQLVSQDSESDSIEGINEALQRASGSGHRLMVGLLIERGAIINDSGALGAASAGGFEDIVQMLLEKGADIEAADNHGSTALHVAAKHGHEATMQLL